MVRRLFTPVQANRTLPLVRRIVHDILEKGRELRGIVAGGVPDAAHRGRLDELQEQVHGLMAELEELGCIYKDWGFAVGLVDFPGKIDGERVLLCWRSDEPAVLHYHGWAEGYAGRKPIPDHLLDADQHREGAHI